MPGVKLPVLQCDERTAFVSPVTRVLEPGEQDANCDQLFWAQGLAGIVAKTPVLTSAVHTLYCAAILLARITSPQSLISRLSNALAAAGVSSSGGYGSMPPSAKICCALGSASAARNAVLSLSMIGCGVRAGASSMCQKSMSSFL